MKIERFLIIIFFLAVSCNDKQDCCSKIPGNNTIFEFSVVNRSGKDLLDIKTENTYNTENIKLYNLVNNEEVLINNPNSDLPKGYLIFQNKGLYLMRVYFDESNLVAKGIIEWNSKKRDTISLEMTQEYKNVKGLIEIRYNNQIVWNNKSISNTDNIYFQIVK